VQHVAKFILIGSLGAAFGVADAAAEIKVGSVVSATGPASFLGDPERKTLELYVEKINAEGGVNGELLELVVYDDEGDANKARTFASRLIDNDEVVAIVGGTTTGTTMAIVPLAEDAEIPFISMAGAVTIIEPVKPFVFKTPPTDRMACEKIFADMKAQGTTKIGMISGTDSFGSSMREQCLAIAEGQDIEVLADETYGPRDSDMTPQLTKIRGAAGVQAVLNPGFGQGPAIVTRNYKQLGIDLPLYQSHGVASKSFIELAGDAAEGVRLPGMPLLVAELLPDDDPQKPVLLAYQATYQEKWGQPASSFGGYAYDGLHLLLDAMTRAGSSEPLDVRDELEKTQGFVGISGVFDMSEADHLGLDLSAFRMVRIENGNWTLIDK
jgi:branched-chain amino acid transport system substrate-binding protein